MKVRITFDFNDRDRLVMANEYGKRRPASREDFRMWIDALVNGALEDLHFDFEREHGEPAEEKTDGE